MNITPGCEPSTKIFVMAWELDGTVDGFKDPDCTGTADWLGNKGCKLRVSQRCLDRSEEYDIVLSTKSDTFDVEMSYTKGSNGCSVKGTLKGTRRSM